MFELFHSIFGAAPATHGTYPEDLIERATERAVDGTDRRLRAVSGYKKRLRPAVIGAIDHVVALVDGLPTPLELDRTRYGVDPELNAFFASVEHMHDVLARDAEMRRWQASPDSQRADRVYALMLMELNERNVLGIALEGNELRHDVAQVTVSFGKHRLADPTAAETETRRLLKRRAFDHLLTLALAAMAQTHGERGELARERDLLRSKLAALATGRWGFDEAANGEDATATDPRALEQRIKAIDAELSERSTGLLDEHLEVLAATLAQAGKHLAGQSESLTVDRQGVKQSQPGAQAPMLELTRLSNSAGRSLIIRLVSITRAELPPPPDFLREAARYLG